MEILLMWIGWSIIGGIFIITGTIRCRNTYRVYSDILEKIEQNIARLENLQEQAGAATAVAEAVNPHRDPE
jgi:hypothetical protein